MPPAPSNDSISYGPSFNPGANAIGRGLYLQEFLRGQSELGLRAAGVNHLDHGAVVTERRSRTKRRYGGKDLFHISFLSRGFEPLIVKKVSGCVLSFSYAIGHQNQAITIMKVHTIALVSDAR